MRRKQIPGAYQSVYALFVFLAALGPAMVHADVPAPDWKFIANSIRIVNVQDYPDFVVLAFDQDGSYTVVRSKETLTCAAPWAGIGGLAFYAIRKSEFHEEELGSGNDAHTDYFENNEHLIRCKVYAEPCYANRGSPIVGIEQILKITALNDTRFDICHVKDVISYGNGDVKEKSVSATDHLAPFRDFFPIHLQRCIRIQDMADHPERAFLMRYRDGYKLMTPNRDINYGRLYAIDSAALHPDDIPEGRAEQWDYFVESKELSRVPLRLSVLPDLNKKPYTDKITDVFAVDSVTTGLPNLGPVKVVYTHSNGTVEEKPASEVAYETEPTPLHGVPDSALSKPSEEMAQYVHIQGLDNFPDFIFLRDWPRSDRVVGPLDTLALGSVYVTPKKEFHAEKLLTRDQRRDFLRCGKATELYLNPASLRALLPRDSHTIRVVYQFRLVRPSTGAPWCLPISAMCTYASGTTWIKEYPKQQDSISPQPSPEASDSDTATVKRTGRREPRRLIRTGRPTASRWFSVLWFVLLPIVALAGIALVLVRRRTRRVRI